MKTTTQSGELGAGAAFVRLALASVAAIVVAAAVGYVPTRALVGEEGIGAMCIGAAIALIAALAGLVPPLLTLRLEARVHMQGMLAGMAVRFLLAVALLLAALLGGLGHKATLAFSTAIGYIVLLAVDTLGLAWLMKRNARSAS